MVGFPINRSRNQGKLQVSDFVDPAFSWLRGLEMGPVSGSPKPHCKELLKVWRDELQGDKQHDQESGAEYCRVVQVVSVYIHSLASEFTRVSKLLFDDDRILF